MPLEKTCVLCGEDCSAKARVKDRQGNYYCKTCHADEVTRKRKLEVTPRPSTDPVAEKLEPGDVDPFINNEAIMARQAAAGDMLGLEVPAPSAPDDAYGLEEQSQDAATGGSGIETRDGPSVRCPGCDASLPAATKVCVTCGINVDTGRAIVMSRGVDEKLVHYNAERVLRPLSWLMSFGFSPVASEAFGIRKPYVTWAVLTISCIVSFWFWFSSDAQMRDRKNLMLWGGDMTPSAAYILEYYELANWGDRQALNNQMRALDDDQGKAASRMDAEVLVQAHALLNPRERSLGEYRSSQLLTHALLHADIFHLAGNMVFLIIFGSRVNALIGNIATLVLYPLLAIAAAWAELMSLSSLMPMPMLGASGAIMGLAGMYLVFFPLNRMHMSIWFRFLFFFRMKVWALRGLWVVLFYIAWDVMYISLGSDTGVAHWAHLGGFIAGVVLALSLLLSRVFYAGGTDLLSVSPRQTRVASHRTTERPYEDRVLHAEDVAAGWGGGSPTGGASKVTSNYNIALLIEHAIETLKLTVRYPRLKIVSLGSVPVVHANAVSGSNTRLLACCGGLNYHTYLRCRLSDVSPLVPFW